MEIYEHKETAQDIRYISREDREFPKKLKELNDCPDGIYVRGALPDPDRKTVAIVGARMCSPAGRANAFYFAQVMAQNGVQVISGLALGIDGAAHEGALHGRGRTFAVLAGGADICYPRAHIGIYCQMQEKGGIISEEPPGFPPLPKMFPKRNRLISAFSDMVLIVEAKKRSGSLITADYACEQGKELFAVPGRLEDELSYGCNELIAQGAGLALSPERLLEIIGQKIEKSDNSEKIMQNVLARDEDMVYSCLSLQPKGLEELCHSTGLSPTEAAEAVVKLQLRSLVKEIGRNRYVRA